MKNTIGKLNESDMGKTPLKQKASFDMTGEFSQVRRMFEQSKAFNFVSGTEKINTPADVAYIFQKLEDKAIENAFAVLVKDGEPTILHLGMGCSTSVPVDPLGIFRAVAKINPDKIYFIHNHPSGNLLSSDNDRSIYKKLKYSFKERLQPGIIINLDSGKFGIYDDDGDIDSLLHNINTGKEIPLKLYSFSKQVFSKNYNPEKIFKVLNSSDAAQFISSHKFGKRKKMSFLALRHDGHVVGNVLLPYTEITHENVGKIAKDIVFKASAVGGIGVIPYGTFSGVDKCNNLMKNIKELSLGHIRMTDAIYIDKQKGVYASWGDEGGFYFSVPVEREFAPIPMAEPEMKYKTKRKNTMRTRMKRFKNLLATKQLKESTVLSDKAKVFIGVFPKPAFENKTARGESFRMIYDLLTLNQKEEVTTYYQNKYNHKNKNSINHKKQKIMDTKTKKTEETGQEVAAQQAEQTPAEVQGQETSEVESPDEQNPKKSTFKVNDRESAAENAASNFWDAYNEAKRKFPKDKMDELIQLLKERNLPIDQMKENGDLLKLEDFKKTDRIYELPKTFTTNKGEEKTIDTQARISLKIDPDGTINIVLHELIQNPKFEKYGDHVFTPEQKESLQERNMAGELIYVKFGDDKFSTPVIITKDELTNRLYHANSETIKIHPEFLGVEITPDEIQRLKEGKMVKLENMTSSKGNVFSAEVYYCASKRGLTCHFDEPLQKIEKLGGLELTPEQSEKLDNNETIYLKGLTDETGKKYDAYVRRNPKNGKPQYSKTGKFNSVNHIMTEAQKKQIEAGATLEMDNLIDDKGQPYTAFVRKDMETGKIKQSKDGTFTDVKPENSNEKQVDPNNKGVGTDKESQKAIDKGATVKARQTMPKKAEKSKFKMKR